MAEGEGFSPDLKLHSSNPKKPKPSQVTLRQSPSRFSSNLCSMENAASESLKGGAIDLLVRSGAKQKNSLTGGRLFH